MSAGPSYRGRWWLGFDFILMRMIVAILHPAVVLVRALSRWRTDFPDRHVVFIAEYPRVREAKLSWVLRRLGWTTHLIYVNKPNFDLDRFFSDAQQVSSPLRAYWAAARQRAPLYHMFSLSGDPYVALLSWFRLGKIIFDPVDILECHFTPDSPKRRLFKPVFEWTRLAIARADGVCARDLQSLYARRKFGYARPRHVVFFPEYCWGADLVGAPTPAPVDGDIHIAVPGIFGLERDGEGDWGYLRIGRLLARAGLHLHLFVHWINRDTDASRRMERFAEFENLRRETGRIHFENTVPIENVVKRLRDFHFGICAHDYAVFAEPARTFDPAVHRYGSSGRNFEWVDAGRAVLTTREFSLWWHLFGRYGCLIECPPKLEGIDAVLRDALAPGRQAARAAAQAALSLDRHGARLVRFYEAVLGR